ncbi:NPCBM/NEW2 domain-containing protein [Streptomyces sp. NPDC002643]
MSAFTGVVGLILGFFGVPSLVTPPTARTVTATVTATATTTVTASPTAEPSPSDTADAPGANADSSTSPTPSTEVPLTDVEAVDTGQGGWERKAATMGGKRFDNSIVNDSGGYEWLSYSINERYKRLTVTVGLDDDGVAYPGTVTFISGELGDGKTLKSANAQINRPVEVTVDVTGVAILTIHFDGDGAVVLGDPVLHRT